MTNNICPVCGGELPESTNLDDVKRTTMPATRRPGEPCICNEEIHIPGDPQYIDPASRGN